MRFATTALVILGLGLPMTAAAGDNVSHAPSGFEMSQEKGVTIYRGHHPEHNFQIMAAMQQRKDMHIQARAFKNRLAAQQRQLHKQNAAIAALNERAAQQQTLQTKPRRRGRYGRTYSGNNRFFGRNGFIGNSNFSGATQPVRRPRHRPYNRRSKH